MLPQSPPSRTPATLNSRAESPTHRPLLTIRPAHLGFALAAVWIAIVFVLVSSGA